jgi:hypothetical protein
MTEGEVKDQSPTTEAAPQETSTDEPCTKKLKMDNTTATTVTNIPEAPDSEWPESWLIAEHVEDQKKLNKLEPNVPVSASELRDIGIR